MYKRQDRGRTERGRRQRQNRQGAETRKETDRGGDRVRNRDRQGAETEE